MIISVKRKGFRSKRAMFFTLIVLLIGFFAYYKHMGIKELPQPRHIDKIIIKKKTAIKKPRNKAEDIIYTEAKTAVNLVGQRHIQKVKIFNNRLLIVCDPRTNIKPLIIRYGALALIQSTVDNIQIAVDLKRMVEDKYDKK